MYEIDRTDELYKRMDDIARSEKLRLDEEASKEFQNIFTGFVFFVSKGVPYSETTEVFAKDFFGAISNAIGDVRYYLKDEIFYKHPNKPNYYRAQVTILTKEPIQFHPVKMVNLKEYNASS